MQNTTRGNRNIRRTNFNVSLDVRLAADFTEAVDWQKSAFRLLLSKPSECGWWTKRRRSK